VDGGSTWTDITDEVSGTAVSWDTTLSGSSDIRFKVTDAAGNDGPVTSRAYVLDTAAPTLSSSSPSDDATGVALDSNITLTFGEDIALGDSGAITVTDGSDTHTIEVSSHGGQLSVSGNTLTIDLSGSLANSESAYHVEIDSGAIEDLAGNDFPGISDAATLNFETAASKTTVVFDFTATDPTNLTGTFETGDYDIYIKIPATSGAWVANDYNWSGGDTLGEGDTVTLVAPTGGAYRNNVTSFSGNFHTNTTQAWNANNGAAVNTSAAWLFGGKTFNVEYSGNVSKTDALWVGSAMISLMAYATATAF
jgi:methionine-rich copper-binding protein CopC